MIDFNLSLQTKDVNVLSEAVRTGTSTITSRRRNEQRNCSAARLWIFIAKGTGRRRNWLRC